MKWRLIPYVVVLAAACGGVEDPSTNNQIGEPAPRTNNGEETRGDVVIRNLRVTVFDDSDWKGCRAVTSDEGNCPVYELTFALQNLSSDLTVDRVTGATLSFNDGEPNIDLNFTCDKVPWFIEPGSQSNVIDMTFSYGGNDRSDPFVSFSCGLVEDSPDSYERPEFEFDGLLLGPAGPTSGTVELRLDGLMGDASQWQTRTETSF